ncbi:MAG: caspase family protein [Sphaerochaetaceae bacterium]|nr:caspase family protein [Spirochaetales bacterium]MDY5499431.1 caspase family protein [Sphaerochaetaceae bacterium]
MIWMLLLGGMLFASCSLPGPELPRAVHILSIGISYEGTDAQPLRGTVNDANELLAAFSQRYESCTTQLLVEEAATKERVVQALTSMPRGELTIIIFSGHGVAGGNWVLRDPKGKQFGTDGKVKQKNLLAPDELWRIIDCRPEPVLVISDSCYSGNILPSSASVSSPNDKERKLSLGSCPDSRFALVCTTRENTGKEDRNSHRHGYFTRALLDELGWDHEQGKLASPPRAITLDNLYEGVLQRQELPVDGPRRRSQHPVVSPGPWELWL